MHPQLKMKMQFRSEGGMWPGDDESNARNGLQTSMNEVKLSVIIRSPVTPEDPPHTSTEIKGRLRDYTKCRGKNFDAVVPSNSPPYPHTVASLAGSSCGSDRFLSRSKAYSSLQSLMIGTDSQEKTSSTRNEGGEWTDQVDFLLKVPCTKLKRHQMCGPEFIERRSCVEKLRESLGRMPSLEKRSLIVLQADLQQASMSNRELRDSDLPSLDEAHSLYSDIVGRRSLMKPRTSIIRREIEASRSHSSNERESCDLISSTPKRRKRAISLEQLFLDLQVETVQKANVVRTPLPRIRGYSHGFEKDDLGPEYPSPAA